MTNQFTTLGSFDRICNVDDDRLMVCHDFDSLEDLLEMAERGQELAKAGRIFHECYGKPLPHYGPRGGKNGYSDKDIEWQGGMFEDAIRMGRVDGWNEAVELIDDARVETEGARGSLEFLHDVAGSDIDMARFMDGEPECMIEPNLLGEKLPLVSLLVNFSCSWRIDASTILRRASVVSAVVESMRSRGVALELFAGQRIAFHHKDDNVRSLSTCVRVGDSRDAIDPAITAFALGHPAMLRQVIFAYENSLSSNFHDAVGWGRGTPEEVDPRMLPDGANSGAIVLIDKINSNRAKFDPVELMSAIDEAIESQDVVRLW